MTDLTCAQMVEWITDYLEGALPPEELAQFRAHLLSCDGCEAYLDQMGSTVRMLRSTPAERLSADPQEAVMAAFRRWSRERSAS